MTTARAEHWDDVYDTRDLQRVSWHRVDLEPSLSITRSRLTGQPGAEKVGYVASDVLGWEPGRTFHAWHDREGLARLFAPAFELEQGFEQVHLTPSGTPQQFTWVVLRRAEGADG